MVEQGTHKPLVESPNLSLGTKNGLSRPTIYGGLYPKEATFSLKEISKSNDYILSIRREDCSAHHVSVPCLIPRFDLVLIPAEK